MNDGVGDDTEIAGQLESKYLPVLNGLVYTSTSCRRIVMKEVGLIPLLHLLTRDIPQQVKLLGLFVIVNLILSRGLDLQNKVRHP